jgi:hypothetical protein
MRSYVSVHEPRKFRPSSSVLIHVAHLADSSFAGHGHTSDWRCIPSRKARRRTGNKQCGSGCRHAVTQLVRGSSCGNRGAGDRASVNAKSVDNADQHGNRPSHHLTKVSLVRVTRYQWCRVLPKSEVYAGLALTSSPDDVVKAGVDGAAGLASTWLAQSGRFRGSCQDRKPRCGAVGTPRAQPPKPCPEHWRFHTFPRRQETGRLLTLGWGRLVAA